MPHVHLHSLVAIASLRGNWACRASFIRQWQLEKEQPCTTSMHKGQPYLTSLEKKCQASRFLDSRPWTVLFSISTEGTESAHRFRRQLEGAFSRSGAWASRCPPLLTPSTPTAAPQTRVSKRVHVACPSFALGAYQAAHPLCLPSPSGMVALPPCSLRSLYEMRWGRGQPSPAMYAFCLTV
jgi:hypothetical protein